MRRIRRSMLATRLALWSLIFVTLVLTGAVRAQETDPARLILNAMNETRIRDNVVHLVPNPVLDDVAARYLADLTQRPLSRLGDVYVTTNGRDISALLDEAGYTAYPQIDYVADVTNAVVFNFTPDEFVDRWIEDARTTREILSLRVSQGSQNFVPVFSTRYREVGIAYTFNERLDRHFYSLVFASQPNVLPVAVTLPEDVPVIVDETESRDVVLYVHDERVNRFGTGEIIGGVTSLRASEDSAPAECPDGFPDEWQPYRPEISFTLSEGPGQKNIFVQLCDDNGFSVVSEAQVRLLGAEPPTPQTVQGFPTPDVNAIAGATQTAAASATAYAPFEATVEAILTATAAAPE